MEDLYRSDREMVLVALGGNALIKEGERGTISEQEKNADDICGKLMVLVERDYNIVLTHGNGPQVGIQIIKNELAKDIFPMMPFDVLVAETEGSMGYFLQNAFLNHLRRKNIRRYVVTVITQVVVDRDDPAFKKPTKPVGMFYSEQEAKRFAETFNWTMVEDAGRGWRRVVPSPKPQKVIQRFMVRHAAQEGNIVIAAGGGGIPIWIKGNNDYEGVEAVVDKDLSSAILGTLIEASLFIILMPLSKVYVNFGKPDQRPLVKASLEELKKYYEEGQFPPGNMGPKIEAVSYFLEHGGRRAIITNPESLALALDEKEGSHFYP